MWGHQGHGTGLREAKLVNYSEWESLDFERSVTVQVFLVVTLPMLQPNTWYTKYLMVSWLQGRNRMAEGPGWGELVISWRSGSRESKKGPEKEGQETTFTSERPTFSNQDSPPSIPFSFNFNNELSHWWSQGPHDPITFQKCHLWTHETVGWHFRSQQ